MMEGKGFLILTSRGRRTGGKERSRVKKVLVMEVSEKV